MASYGLGLPSGMVLFIYTLAGERMQARLQQALRRPCSRARSPATSPMLRDDWEGARVGLRYDKDVSLTMHPTQRIALALEAPPPRGAVGCTRTMHLLSQCIRCVMHRTHLSGAQPSRKEHEAMKVQCVHALAGSWAIAS